MKSYFAKLAARATLANRPASSGSAAAPMFDPFDQTSLSQDTAPAPVVTRSGPASDYSSVADARGSALPQTQPVGWALETIDSAARGPERSASPPPQPQLAPSEPLSEVRIDPTAPGIPSESRSEQRGIEQPSPRAAAPLALQAERPPVPPPAYEPYESEQVGTKTIAHDDERLAEIEREQAALLRKSDAFMESLRRRREAPANRPEEESNETEARISSRQEKPWEPKQPRLQPSPPAPRQPEPDDLPSLVIGSLTVEVATPAPPPVAPRREVIVVGGGSPTVRRFVPSSRRFGWGHF